MKKAYVGYSLDEELREESTSGGICQLISKMIILENGVVSGVQFDKNFNVERGFASNLEEVKRFNKSKYVQANQKDSYVQIRNYLFDNRKVLFIGTPCQVAGLKGFLGKDYCNLYTIDFVCLGVPSSKAWDKYKEQLTRKSPIKEINFKDKKNGWKNFKFKVTYNDSDELIEEGRRNDYMKSMIYKYNSRPSCYCCQFRKMDRIADITVADAWGIEKLVSQLNDDKGTSAIMVNNNKGEMLLDLIKNQCQLYEVSPEKLWEGNKSAFKQYNKPLEREFFYKYIEKYNYYWTMRLLKIRVFIKKIKRSILRWR